MEGLRNFPKAMGLTNEGLEINSVVPTDNVYFLFISLKEHFPCH